MRILRGLGSRRLPCGCVVGIYETYRAQIVALVDARAEMCGSSEHVPGRPINLEEPRHEYTE